MTIHFTADRGDARLRLDQVLVRRVSEVSGLSRAQAQRWIADGLVSIDAVPAGRSSARVREGAAVEVTLPASSRLREAPQPEALPLDVLYEDEHLLAVNKPAGMVVHPSFRNTSGTVLNGVTVDEAYGYAYRYKYYRTDLPSLAQNGSTVPVDGEARHVPTEWR